MEAAAAAGEDVGEVAGAGGDLEAGTLLAAYRLGLFPMGLGGGGTGPLGWWSPDPRGVLPLDGLRVSRSLRRSVRRYATTLDAAFDDVVAGCADPSRAHRWITPEVAAAYGRLHRLGWAHSVEVWEGRPGERLVGGLYGVGVGGLFAGESMFSRATDASKVALVRLVSVLARDGDPRRLLDVQWRTDHLASLGVVEVPRAEYSALLRRALAAPQPAW
ncbi:leucyl/phenylalanyl-tRNA--protein transferase [Quadrisphaera sp. KR29]|uniref:leucyl/phenylalanyl-tRNA--protein transferase n=1 Tax=Quadrisphaera sp. KR29 TaxID=3461391 RepID=UPI004044DA45